MLSQKAKEGDKQNGIGGRPSPPPCLVKKPDVCAALQICPSHLDNLIQEHRIPFVRIGRSIRFDLDEVIKSFKKQK